MSVKSVFSIVRGMKRRLMLESTLGDRKTKGGGSKSEINFPSDI